MNSSPYLRNGFKLLIISAAFFLASCNSYQSSMSSVTADGKGNYLSISAAAAAVGGLYLHSNDSASLIDQEALPLMSPLKGPDGAYIYLKQSSSSRIGIYSEKDKEHPLAELRVSPYNLDVKTSKDKILFSAFMPGWFSVSHKYYIYDLSSASMSEITVPELPYPYTLNISADGTKLIFSRGRGITVRDLASSQEKTYCDDTDFGSVPRFIAMSPDSAYLCFRAGRVKAVNINSRDNDFTNVDPFNVRYDIVNKRGVYLLDLKASTLSPLKFSDDSASYPVFSPDSGKLAYINGSSVSVYDIKSASLSEANPWIYDGRYRLNRSIFWIDSNTLAAVMNNDDSLALMLYRKADESVKIFPLSRSAH